MRIEGVFFFLFFCSVFLFTPAGDRISSRLARSMLLQVRVIEHPRAWLAAGCNRR
jgi:hypothetical protein